MKIFIFDFDETIPSGHTHDAIAGQIRREKRFGKSSPLESDNTAQFAIAREIVPIGTPQEWRELFADILAKGHKIAIASFNAYGHIIPTYLTEVLGMPTEIVNEIFIVAHPELNLSHKQSHINEIAAHFYQSKIENIPVEAIPSLILIDDDMVNLHSAHVHGHPVIKATKAGDHLIEMRALFNQDLTQHAVNTSGDLLKELKQFNDESMSLEERPRFFFTKTAMPTDSTFNNSFFVTAEFKLYFLDKDGKQDEYSIDPKKLRACFKSYDDLWKMINTSVIDNYNISDFFKRNGAIMDDINKLIMESVPGFFENSQTLFSNSNDANPNPEQPLGSNKSRYGVPGFKK